MAILEFIQKLDLFPICTYCSNFVIIICGGTITIFGLILIMCCGIALSQNYDEKLDQLRVPHDFEGVTISQSKLDIVNLELHQTIHTVRSLMVSMLIFGIVLIFVSLSCVFSLQCGLQIILYVLLIFKFSVCIMLIVFCFKLSAISLDFIVSNMLAGLYNKFTISTCHVCYHSLDEILDMDKYNYLPDIKTQLSQLHLCDANTTMSDVVIFFSYIHQCCGRLSPDDMGFTKDTIPFLCCNRRKIISKDCKTTSANSGCIPVIKPILMELQVIKLFNFIFLVLVMITVAYILSILIYSVQTIAYFRLYNKKIEEMERKPQRVIA